MNRIILLGTATGLTLALAGCGTLSSSPGGPPAPHAALNFTPVLADGAVATVQAAQQSTDGMDGFAAIGGSAAPAGLGARSAPTTVGTLGVANVKTNADMTEATFMLGSQPYTLSGSGNSGSETIGGKNFATYFFGNAQGPDQGSDGAAILNSEYVSLAILTRGGTTWEPAPGADGQFTLEGMNQYGMIVTGLQTPVADLPSQTAEYRGDYFFAAIAGGEGVFGAEGEFAMTADFANGGTMTGKAWDSEGVDSNEANPHTLVNATIVNGNQFQGKLIRVIQPITGYSPGINGDVIGGFYGPNAEQVAGAGVGLAQPAAVRPGGGAELEIPVSAVFLGVRQ